MAEGVLTGNMAIIRSRGQVIGRMKNIRYTENMRRVEVRGIGSTYANEVPIIEASGALTCDFMEMNFVNGGIPGAINRNFSVIRSQALLGKESFEDTIILDTEGIQIDIYKKVADFYDPITRVPKPKVKPFAIIPHAFIESDSFDISESNISGRNQSFKCTDPIIFPQ